MRPGSEAQNGNYRFGLTTHGVRPWSSVHILLTLMSFQDGRQRESTRQTGIAESIDAIIRTRRILAWRALDGFHPAITAQLLPDASSAKS